MSDDSRDPRLQIDLVDRDLLYLSARGPFSSEHRDDVERRIEQLLSCGFTRLRIDFADATTLDPSVADVFRRAGNRLQAAGGAMELIRTQPDVARALGVDDGPAAGRRLSDR